MKVTKLAIALLAATGLSAIATPAMAYEAGDWLVRGRIINVNPNDDSGTLTLNGVDSGLRGVKVDSDTVPELDITYMVDRNWGIELILGYSEHTVTGEKGWAGLGDVIDTKVLPPTLTLQYHFAPDSNIRPYIGAGVNYTYFFDEKVAGSELPGAGAKVKLEDSWGLAAQAGVDIAINDDWFVNLDVKYIQIDTTAKFSNTAAGSAQQISADINPFLYGIGVGRRF
ncbi:MAG: OmpW family protein [Pseudomonadota bacterium]|nr:OmpW family protein [Pseudomonadota bacterium]MDO7667272.1 OmpW family protein [Pseudomonadota bacterium]MDO7711022.1 OmpW family protein [Pseudomonadota bacterium]